MSADLSFTRTEVGSFLWIILGYMRYITGSSGFVGSHLSKKLDTTSIAHKDIETIKLEPFTHFYFLSSYGNMASHTDEDTIFKANVDDLLSILKQARKFKFKSFVYISSSSVMLRTQTTYSRCKRAAEELLLAFMEKTDLPVCIIRPFSITGVGEQQEHLIPTLLRAAKTGETVNFVPNAVHDYIDVDDVVDGIISLSEHAARGIYQLGTGKSTSNQEVLEIVEEVTGKKVKVNLVNSMRAYDTENWASNNFKARGWGWFPKVSLRTSIEKQYATQQA